MTGAAKRAQIRAFWAWYNLGRTGLAIGSEKGKG